MKDTPQEKYARELYARLEQQFSTIIPEVTLTIEGKGVQWKCIATREKNACLIHCFDYFREGPEYACYFECNEQRMATGRTPLLENAANAVERWLQGADISEMYKGFAFIDGRKRAMQKLEQDILAIHPELAECATLELRQEYGEFYHFWLSTTERACHFSFWGRNELPDCFLDWDRCNLAKVQQSDKEQLAWAIKRWLCDSAMPSELEKEFSWLNFGKLGYYYEQGRGIEGEFIVSWDHIEEFFKEFEFPWIPEALEFIAQLRQKGYDHTLRAGHSMTIFVVSRSRHYGLRPEQPSIAFIFNNDGMKVNVDDNGIKILSFPTIELNDQVEAELKRLEAKAID